MFVRFRQSDRRLQASLTETRRQGGKVRHEHVAGLGSVPVAPSIHARIPMPTMDDHQAVQLERAQADARFWETLAEMHTDDIEGHKGLLAIAQRKIAECEPLAADTAAKAKAAKDRLARVEQGEDVAGIGPPLTRKDILRITGMIEAKLRHCERVAGIAAKGEDWWRLMVDEAHRRKANVERTVVRQLHRMATAEDR